MRFNNRILGNALWIIGCKIGQAILQLLITMFMARYLGPSNYGIINYAVSLVTFFQPLMKLGMDGILVHELISEPRKEGTILGTVIVMNLISGLLCIAGIIGFVCITTPGDTDTLIVTLLYSLVLLMEAVQMLQYWFQAKLISKYTSLAMLFAYVVMSAYQLYLLITGKTLYWFAIAKTLDVFVIDILLVILYFKLGGNRFSFSKSVAFSLFAKSKYYILSSMMVTIFAQCDRIMLKMMINDTATGLYSAAVTCATMAGFVFSAIIDSMRPGILSSKQISQRDFEKKMAMLYTIVIYVSLVFCIAIMVFAPLIVKILYGIAYVEAVNPLRISILASTFSYIGAVRNVWILAEQKQEYLWRINACGAIANVVLNYILIPYWGINGAASVTLVTQIITNVVINFAIRELRGSVVLMTKGIVAHDLICAIKKDDAV